MEEILVETIFLVCLFLLLAACSNETNESPVKQEVLTDSNTAGDLIIARISDISSLDPHGSNDSFSGNVQKNIYETLVNRNLNNEIVPGLAAAWERNDELTWTFTLHENITFHDGSPLNAEVVKMNLDRVRDPKTASPKAFLFEMVEEVTVIDPLTIQIKTAYPFSPLLAHLTHSGGGIR